MGILLNIPIPLCSAILNLFFNSFFITFNVGTHICAGSFLGGYLCIQRRTFKEYGFGENIKTLPSSSSKVFTLFKQFSQLFKCSKTSTKIIDLYLF